MAVGVEWIDGNLMKDPSSPWIPLNQSLFNQSHQTPPAKHRSPLSPHCCQETVSHYHIFPHFSAIFSCLSMVPYPLFPSLSLILPTLKSCHSLFYYLTTYCSFNGLVFMTLDVFPLYMCSHHFVFPNWAMPSCQPPLLSHNPDGSWDHITSFVGFLF